MKKMYLLFCPVIFLCMMSCSNETPDSSDAEKSVTTTPPATPPADKVDPPAPQKRDHVEVKSKETARTEISIGQKGGSVKTKKGTDVSVSEKGVKVGTKDVRIDIKRDTNW